MKKAVAIFLAGNICGALMLQGVIILRNFGRGFSSWGNTVAYSDIQVRQAIKESGIQLPAEAWDLFYAIDGFRDHGVWIAFTVPRDQLWSTVEASLHKTREDFAAGTPHEFMDQVDVGKDQLIDTGNWTPKTIRDPLHWSIREGNYMEAWVVDEGDGRVYTTKVRW